MRAPTWQAVLHPHLAILGHMVRTVSFGSWAGRPGRGCLGPRDGLVRFCEDNRLIEYPFIADPVDDDDVDRTALARIRFPPHREPTPSAASNPMRKPRQSASPAVALMKSSSAFSSNHHDLTARSRIIRR
jgi:hypothetical protein